MRRAWHCIFLCGISSCVRAVPFSRIWSTFDHQKSSPFDRMFGDLQIRGLQNVIFSLPRTYLNQNTPKALGRNGMGIQERDEMRVKSKGTVRRKKCSSHEWSKMDVSYR
ncbi:hypothetical protein BHE74_00047479, partial [Ensete ventricosum]